MISLSLLSTVLLGIFCFFAIPIFVYACVKMGSVAWFSGKKQVLGDKPQKGKEL